MVYSDDTGRRIRRRPIKRHTPLTDSGTTEADTRYILQVAEENPRFTPDEVHAEILYGRGRQDITNQMVRAVLA